MENYIFFVLFLIEPSLADLLLLRVVEWYEVGLYLGLDETELKIIQHDNPRDLKACVRKMFALWLQNDENPSYMQLLHALVAAEDKGAIQELCSKHGMYIYVYFIAY